MYRRGARVMAFYNFVLDANDLLWMSEIEISDCVAADGVDRLSECGEKEITMLYASSIKCLFNETAQLFTSTNGFVVRHAI